jgi:hypothetical protein
MFAIQICRGCGSVQAMWVRAFYVHGGVLIMMSIPYDEPNEQTAKC